MMIARLWSCNAPETISEAEAEPSLIKTTIGAPFNTSPECKPGTDIKVTIVRKNTKPFVVKITREIITIISVKGYLECHQSVR
jgi:predicted aconitase